MSEFARFDMTGLDALRRCLNRLGLSLPIGEGGGVLRTPLMLGRFTLPNRFVILPMEGVDAKQGAPGELTFRRYRRYGAGAAAVVWFEAVAVEESGRSSPRQLLLNERTADAFARLVEATRQAARDAHGGEVVCIVQLTHSGRFSRPGGDIAPVIAQRNPFLESFPPPVEDASVATDEELCRLQDAYVTAAALAERAGFDGVDIKACHGYLLGELLGARTRPGRFGGSYENRTRLLTGCIARVRELRPDFLLACRLSGCEPSPYPYGWGVAELDGRTEMDLREPLRLAGELAALGVELVGVTAGYPRVSPHWNRPYDRPLVGRPEPPEHPLVGVARLADVCRQFQQALESVPVVAAGLGWLRHLMPTVATGMVEQGWAGLIGLGRNAFAYPDAPRDIMETGRMDPDRCCIACSMCSQIMADGVAHTGCVIRDSDVYAREYRAGRAAAKARDSEEAGTK